MYLGRLVMFPSLGELPYILWVPAACSSLFTELYAPGVPPMWATWALLLWQG